MSIADKLTIIAENEQKVYDSGYKRSDFDFWDVFQKQGNKTNYSYAFYNWGGNYSIYNPIYPIVADGAYNADGAFAWFSDMLETKQNIVLKSCRLSNIFTYCTSLKTIKYIETDEFCDFFGEAFEACENLETLNWGGIIGKSGLNLQWSKKLTHDSLISVLNCLKDYSIGTNGETYTVTLGSENIAKLTEDEKDIAYLKGWQLA